MRLPGSRHSAAASLAPAGTAHVPAFLIRLRDALREWLLKRAILAEQQIAVYTPVPPDKPNANPESQRKRAWQRRREPDAIKAWRERMADEAGKAVYQRRSRIGATKQRDRLASIAL